jgi:predicted nucleic acid-binding protein
MLVAAVALSNEIPLYTLNPGDFAGLAELLEIVSPVP